MEGPRLEGSEGIRKQAVTSTALTSVIAKFLRAIIPVNFRPSGHIAQLARTRTDGRVNSGPFTGMRYISGADGGVHIPKLLGIYERELNPHIENACTLDFRLIVDVGAAEGYYAVGMALRNPKARVIAFEMEANAQAVLVESVELNRLADRVEIRGKCQPEDLEQALADARRPLVICDTEGYESVLLDQAAVPSLQRAAILVELHEFVERGISEKILKRFVGSHKIIRIWQQERTITEFPFKDLYTLCLPKSYLRWAVSESRPERMSWFWMEPWPAHEQTA